MDDPVSVAGRLKGISGFVLVDCRGRVKGHNLGAPGSLSKLAFSCGRRLAAIGKENFRYACFSRENGEDILIFPVGNDYLGVVKLKGIKNSEVASAVLEAFQATAG